ncbi:MAG: ATP-dependent DNA ligase, partial [Bacteroidota bacterium]
MKEFGILISALDSTTKTTEKLSAMASFLEKSSSEDKLWFVALLSGKRPKRPVKTTLLREWAAEVSKMPLWLLEESYHVVGDLAETVALILPNETKTSDKSLDSRMRDLQSLKELEEEEVKAYITTAWSEMNKTERFVFNKLITGGFRIGVSQKLIVKALAKHLDEEENIIAHRLMGDWSPLTTTFEKLLVEPDENENLSRPYPFYLAYPLEDEPKSLGDVDEWQLEYKWDGIRGQLIRRNGQVYIWSRGEELVTERFPELENLREMLPHDCVIDGEIMAFKDGKPLTFNHLQTRIGRKKVSKKILTDSPVVMISYDLLEERGKDLRQSSMESRRAKLEAVVKKTESPALLISEKIEPKSWEEAAAI